MQIKRKHRVTRESRNWRAAVGRRQQLRGISCCEGQQKESGGEGEQTAASAVMVTAAVRDSCKVGSYGGGQQG